jgi:hypothetical protein
VRLPTRSATAAALAAAVALGVPAAAHSPRDARPGAPRMDLEVQVTPPLAGSVSSGGRDAVVAVDAFGNRFAVARKEVATGVVAPDPRARALARAGAWHWFSADEGDTWANLDLLPRGAESALPERADRDVVSDGARTYVAEVGPAGAVVTPVVATKRGRLTASMPGVVPVVTSDGARPSLAAHGGTTVLMVTAAASGGGSQAHASYDGGVTWSASAVPLPGTACDAAADPRPRSRTVVVACLAGSDVVLHTSADDGRTFTARHLGPADTRGGDAGLPQAAVGRDGVPHVLTGLVLRRVLPRGVTAQDLLSEKGAYRSTSLAVSGKGRVGVAAYRLLPGDRGWNVVITVVTPGQAPVWADFAFHDPAGRSAAAGPPSDRTSVAFGPRGRIHLLWTATRLHSAELDAPVLRNVWSVRSTTP